MSPPLLVVLTGGPGAGKTAVLEVAKRHFCKHVVVLQEAASVVFGGGFPHRDTVACRAAAQRAIFRVQRELEQLAADEGGARVVLCDRGTVDGLAYWPGAEDAFWGAFGVTRAAEIARYAAVIHLRPPRAGHGYNHDNTVRVESASEAHRIDARIEDAWAGHPRRRFVASTPRFVDKLDLVMAMLRDELPACCEGASTGLSGVAAS